MSPKSYAYEKLMQAVHALATGVGPLQERLGDAALFLIRLQPQDFPEDKVLRRTFNGVIDDLSFDQGQIAATMNNTSDEDAKASPSASSICSWKCRAGMLSPPDVQPPPRQRARTATVRKRKGGVLIA
jgi:hypothetical protein